MEESAAIILYLIEQYDKEHTLSYDDRIPEKYLCQQWLAFQATSKYPKAPIFPLPTPTG
jgi:glutathione S-transferase